MFEDFGPPHIAVLVIAAALLISLLFGRDKGVKLDMAEWRLYRARKQWHGRKLPGKSFGRQVLNVEFSALDDARNRRITELIQARDVESAAAMLHAAGIDEKEAIDIAERYTLRPHPEAETKGYPAAYSAKDKIRARPRRKGAQSDRVERLSPAEIERRIAQPAAPIDEDLAIRRKIDRLALSGRRLEAANLYCAHFGGDLAAAEAAIKKGVAPRSKWAWVHAWLRRAGEG